MSDSNLSEDRLETRFDQKEPLMSKREALVESNRCLYCVEAPCIDSCPTSIDIPEFIRQLATGNREGSAETILESNILGYSCGQVCPTEVLCESTCVFNEMEEPPIRIGELQRYATEEALDENKQFFEAGEPTGNRVALIGAGPASLACAHRLRRFGHETTIFEAKSRPGGLNTDGVAPYKLKADQSLREIEYVRQIGGIDIEFDTELGTDITLDELEDDYDAVVIGVGLGPDRRLDVDGASNDGVWGAVEFIEKMKMDDDFEVPDDVERVCVVGGGNTAIDVVREMRGLDVDDVALVYRRNEASMSGYDHEWEGAKKEGARGVWWSQPVEVLGDGEVTGLKCRRTRADEDGNIEIVDDSDFEVPCDMVVLAIGQSKLGEMFSDVDDLELKWGRVVIDEETGQTGNPRYFAGGDCISGGQEVVDAVEEGKIAARGIDAMLTDDDAESADEEPATATPPVA